MRFQVRELMLTVGPMEYSAPNDCTCMHDSTHGNGCDDPDCKPSCKAHSCPPPSHRNPKVGREMLGALRDQMRQALTPA